MRSEKRKRFERVICKCCSTGNHRDLIFDSIPKHARSKRRRQSLPTDIVEQVFVRLLARSVVKLRLACKLFDQLTTTLHFISAHTRRCRDRSVIHRNPSPFTSTKLVFQRNDLPKGHLLGASGSHKVSIKALKLPTPIPDFQLVHRQGSFRVSIIFSSDDGLLCTCSRFDGYLIFTVLNPLTSEKFSSAPLFGMYNEAFLIAFYYHAPSATYRALLVLENERGMCTVVYFDRPDGEVRVKETTIEPPKPLFIVDLYEGVLVVPPYIFALAAHVKTRSPLLLVFDTDTERFTHGLELPKGLHLMTDRRLDIENKLIEIAGKLCVFSLHLSFGLSSAFRVQMWVLKDVEQEIWIKKERVIFLEFVHDPQQTYDVLNFMEWNLLLLVNRYNNDIDSPEKEFAIY